MELSLWLCSSEYGEGEEPTPWARQARWLAGNTLGCGHQDGMGRGEVLMAMRGLLTASKGGLWWYCSGTEWALLAEEGKQHAAR